LNKNVQNNLKDDEKKPKIFLTQQEQNSMQKIDYMTMKEKDNEKYTDQHLQTESDSKISINFNINNNYLLKNQINKNSEIPVSSQQELSNSPQSILFWFI
jgi:hypothetical protein